jgi:hypothetical protein
MNMTFLARAAAPSFWELKTKPGTKAPVLSEGAYRYEAIHDWGELP